MNPRRSLGRYEILEPLGQGTHGRVYRARDPIFGDVALKAAVVSERATPEQVEALRERLEVEARRQRELSASCASILPAYDVVVDEDGQVYVVQAYAEGGSLRNVDRPVGDELLLADWGCRLCDALQTAHDASIFHRDVKPENIVRDAAGHPKLTDFGIAVDPPAAERSREARTLVGTPAYLAPELWESNRPGPATDLFSLGVVLYELATGQHPYDLKSADPADIRARLCAVEGLPLRARVAWPQLSAALAEILDKAVARDPAERYRTCNALRRDLAAFREELESRETQVIRDGPLPLPWTVHLRRVGRRIKRRIRPLIAAGAVVAVAAAVWQFAPRTLLPEGWVEEKIEDFQSALDDADPERLLRLIWRNAQGTRDGAADARAVRMFAQLTYYDRVKLESTKFDGDKHIVSVRLVAWGSGLPAEGTVLDQRSIAFEQTEQSRLQWADPSRWIFDLQSADAHRKAVRTIFCAQLWDPLREALAEPDADVLAGLYDTPPDITDVNALFGWLRAYGRTPTLPAWPDGDDPRVIDAKDWHVTFGRSTPDGIAISFRFKHNGERWCLTEPTTFSEPEAHVRWAVEAFLRDYQAKLRTGDAEAMGRALAGASQRPLSGPPRARLEQTLAWLSRTRRDTLRLTARSLEPWQPGEPARVNATLTCTLPKNARQTRVATSEPAGTAATRPAIQTLVARLTFARSPDGRWRPEDAREFAFPEPAQLGAARLLIDTPDFREQVTRINQAAWSERVMYLSTAVSVGGVDQGAARSAVADVTIRGTYRFVKGHSELLTSPLTGKVPLVRGEVLWTMPPLKTADAFAFTEPSEDIAQVFRRFERTVAPTLRSVFAQRRFDPAALAPLLPASATPKQRMRVRKMFRWMKQNRRRLEFSVGRPEVNTGGGNTASIRIAGTFSPGHGLGDPGTEWWAPELHFVERLHHPNGKSTASAPDLRWTLRLPPDAPVQDYAWLPPPRLVRFAPVAAAVTEGSWWQLFERYLPAAVRTALAEDVQRMREWTTLDGTRVTLSSDGQPRVVAEGKDPLHVEVSATLTARYGDAESTRPVLLLFIESADAPGRWTLTTSEQSEEAYREHYLWPEPPAHAAWSVTARLERAAEAYRRADAEAYAEALTGSAADAELFTDFLTEYGPKRYRMQTVPADVAAIGPDEVAARLDLTPRGDALPVDPFEGRFVWRSGGWVAERAEAWLVATKTAARVIRLLRTGRWVEARQLFGELPADRQAEARAAVDRVRLPDEIVRSVSDERHATSGMPQWFVDDHGVRYDLVMTTWPEDGSTYALYIQTDEVSTERCAEAWDAVRSSLQFDGTTAADRVPFWTTRDRHEVTDKLNGAVSGVTWRQAMAFAHQFHRDLPTQREWRSAAEKLDVRATRLAGGVWEWSRDADGEGTGHVILGGCWLHDALGRPPAASLRETQGPVPDDTIGFRTVLRIPSTPISRKP